MLMPIEVHREAPRTHPRGSRGPAPAERTAAELAQIDHSTLGG